MYYKKVKMQEMLNIFIILKVVMHFNVIFVGQSSS